MQAIIKSVAAIFLCIASALFVCAVGLNVASVLHYTYAELIPDNVILLPVIALMFVMVFLTFRLQRDIPQRKSRQVLWSMYPAWAKKVSYGLAAYTFGTWVMLAYIQSKGQTPSPMPFLTCFSMIVTFSAAMMFYSLWRDPALIMSRYCPNGHRISPFDKYCPQCGAAL